jgi:oligoribonuclease (3'-5' exoribonuclease)
MIVTTESEDVRIEIVDVCIATHEHNGVCQRIKVRYIHDFMQKQEPTVPLVTMLVTHQTTVMALKNFSTFFDF